MTEANKERIMLVTIPNGEKEKEDLPPDKLEIIVFNEGLYKHFFTRFDHTKDSQIQLEDISYNISKEHLIQKEQGIIERLRNKPVEYVIFFKEKEPNPMEIDFTEPKVSSRIVYMVLTDTTIKHGISSLFKGQWSFNVNWKLLLFIVFVAVALIGMFYYILTSGGLHF